MPRVQRTGSKENITWECAHGRCILLLLQVVNVLMYAWQATQGTESTVCICQGFQRPGELVLRPLHNENEMV